MVVSASRRAGENDQRTCHHFGGECQGHCRTAFVQRGRTAGPPARAGLCALRGAGHRDQCRGFNSAFNPKNLQINDGRFSSLIATGLPLGALGTTVKEDIERIEVILGPSSALYGPNAHNGLLNTITKDPRSTKAPLSP
ncbi:MAG: TonB-dependent receptor plug domain-containing protein [Lewinellaceae bacterium]|nr:TonB-dependent receptor plug domain-containing protein [Lewinellaceae bacterium]